MVIASGESHPGLVIVYLEMLPLPLEEVPAAAASASFDEIDPADPQAHLPFLQRNI